MRRVAAISLKLRSNLTTDTFPEQQFVPRPSVLSILDLHLTQNFTQGRKGKKNRPIPALNTPAKLPHFQNLTYCTEIVIVQEILICYFLNRLGDFVCQYLLNNHFLFIFKINQPVFIN